MLIKTSAEILHEGLALVGLKQQHQARSHSQTLEECFKGHYGSSALVCSQILSDLQTGDSPACISVKKEQLKYYFQAHHLLAKYQTQGDHASTFGSCVWSDQDWCWFFVEKIAALKAVKITWPDD
jgi:hypothetical protein